MTNTNLKIAGAGGLGAIAIIGLGLVLPGADALRSLAHGQENYGTAQISEEAVIGAQKLSDAFRAASKVLRPSVVTITSLQEQRMRTIRRGGGLGGLPDEFRGLLPDELFEDLQEREYGGDSQGDGQKIQTGVGSGVIVSSEGYILTNNHVIARADELQVELSDGRELTAEVVGRDEKSDVAVLKINADNLIAARLGDSSRMEVGDWVIAVGSPFGLDQTVTAGIISAQHRQTGIISDRNGGYEDFLQTDAAINPGNSGGPLVNLRGEVIGINTAINSRTGTSAGVGFAIPSNMAARIMEDLKSNGEVVRGFIGVRFAREDITSGTASEYGLPRGVRRGAAVTHVQPDGPADKGALKAGDVVTSVGGRAVDGLQTIRSIVALTRPGTDLDFQVYRDGRLVNLKIKVGVMTDEKMNQLAGRARIPNMGIVVESVTPELAREVGSRGDSGGVMITGIDTTGKAASFGMRAGDIILRVDGKAADDPATAGRLLNQADESSRIVVERGNREILLPERGRF